MSKKISVLLMILLLPLVLASGFVIDQVSISMNSSFELRTGFFNWFSILSRNSEASAEVAPFNSEITIMVLVVFIIISISSIILMALVPVYFKKSKPKGIKVFSIILLVLILMLISIIQFIMTFISYNFENEVFIFSAKQFSNYFLVLSEDGTTVFAAQGINSFVFYAILFLGLIQIVGLAMNKSIKANEKVEDIRPAAIKENKQPIKSDTIRANEDSIDLNSKINRLRSDLAKSPAEMNNLTEENAIETSKIEEDIKPQPILKEFVTQELTQPIDTTATREPFITVKDETIKLDREPSKIVEEPQIQEPVDKIIDPYVKTITPRRAGNQKAQEFMNQGPIGVTYHDPLKGFKKNRDLVKPEYENKIFLGDSDRIWNAIRNANRDVLKKHPASLQNQSPQKDYYQPNEAEIEKIKSIYTYDKTIDWGED